MLNFDFPVPTRLVFGRDTQHQVGDLVVEYGGKKVLLLYGGGGVKRLYRQDVPEIFKSIA